MLRRTIAFAGLLIIACAASAFAQPAHRFEASAFAGWAFSDGVSGPTVTTAAGSFNRVDPKDSALWGVSFGFLFSDNAEVGFMYSRQSSKEVLGGTLGTPDFELGDLAISTYHGYLSYNFGESAGRIRPFVYGGLGATNFGSVDFDTPFRSGTIGGNTQFSTTWGGGLKYFFGPKIGARAAATWTPTYIKTDTAGWWCDPFWGCYLVGNPQYSNQFGLTGGVTFRF